VRPFDNVPVVSWVVLRGRCRQCRRPISVRYPLVELTTGVFFAAVGWGFGPHWGVPGYCVLAAALVALVAVERDGLAPPLSVAVIGTAIGASLLVAAGVADRRWPHVIGVVTGVVVAGAIVGLVRQRGRRPVDPAAWTTAAPVLLPVGAALGWLGPAYAAEGLAATVVLLLVIRAARNARKATPSRPGGVVVVLAFTAGVVVATAVAVAVGAGAGV
jgi:leader peptidase (prepilin peptidase)/N-methyltransferase